MQRSLLVESQQSKAMLCFPNLHNHITNCKQFPDRTAPKFGIGSQDDNKNMKAEFEVAPIS
jgi:hypothetical protein